MSIFDNKENQIKFNKILKDFSQATGLATVMVDIHGKGLSDWHQFTPFCTAVRKHPELKEKCEKCDLYGGLEATKENKPVPYTCHAGLTDIAMPIIVNEQLVGFILSGQVKASDNQFPQIYKNSSWQEHTELIELFNHVNQRTSEQIESACEILKILVEHHFPPTKVKKQATEQINFNIYQETTEEKALQQANLMIDKSKKLNPSISKALKFIDKNLTKDTHLKSVAEYVFLNPDYFSRLFKKETGFSFIDYVNHKKIERSLFLLQDKSRTLESISEALGFSQTSYYCKVFKQKMGYSPTDYRKNFLRKNK